MTTYRIYETGNNTGKKSFYAEQKLLWFWVTPALDELMEPFCLRGSSKMFDSKEELIDTIKSAHEKKSLQDSISNSIYVKVIDEIVIPD